MMPSLRTSDARLPEKEARCLRAAIFGADADGERRARVAKLIVGRKGNHGRLCASLARKLRPHIEPEERALLDTLSSFAALADAGIDTMRAVWKVVGDRDAVEGTA
jgi:hypothetical protein